MLRTTRLLLGLALAATAGCYGAHERAVPRGDADVPLDAWAMRADAAISNDAGRDASICGDVDVVLARNIYHLVRAREGTETHLVIGRDTSRVGAMPVEVWDAPFALDGTPSIVVRLVIEGSVGAQPVAAALRGHRLALALDQGSAPDELLVIDMASNTIVARRELDPALTTGFASYAWLALDDTHLLTSVELPEGGTRVRVYDLDPSAEGGLAMRVDRISSVPYMATAAFASVDVEPLVRTVLEGAVGAPAVAAFPRDAGVVVDVDGSAVLVVTGQEVRIDGNVVGTLDPGTTLVYGYPTIAVVPNRAAHVIALATDHGLRWDVLDVGMPLVWTSPSNALLAGSAAAHADASNRGLFFVEGSFDSDPARLRYVGRRCDP